MDISIRSADCIFNFRAAGVILHERKVLAMYDEQASGYYLPGGRVGINESAEQAVLRELREELDVDAAILRPLWLNQPFFAGPVACQRCHELCLYFLIDAASTDLLSRGASLAGSEADHPRVEWIDFARAKDEPLYPRFLRTELDALPETLTLRTEYD